MAVAVGERALLLDMGPEKVGPAGNENSGWAGRPIRLPGLRILFPCRVGDDLQQLPIKAGEAFEAYPRADFVEAVEHDDAGLAAKEGQQLVGIDPVPDVRAQRRTDHLGQGRASLFVEIELVEPPEIEIDRHRRSGRAGLPSAQKLAHEKLACGRLAGAEAAEQSEDPVACAVGAGPVGEQVDRRFRFAASFLAGDGGRLGLFAIDHVLEPGVARAARQGGCDLFSLGAWTALAGAFRPGRRRAVRIVRGIATEDIGENIVAKASQEFVAVRGAELPGAEQSVDRRAPDLRIAGLVAERRLGVGETAAELELHVARPRGARLAHEEGRFRLTMRALIEFLRKEKEAELRTLAFRMRLVREASPAAHAIVI